MITVGGGTGINFSSKRAKDSKNGTAGGQFGVAGTVEAAKVKKYPVRVLFGLGRDRPIHTPTLDFHLSEGQSLIGFWL